MSLVGDANFHWALQTLIGLVTYKYSLPDELDTAVQ